MTRFEYDPTVDNESNVFPRVFCRRVGAIALNYAFQPNGRQHGSPRVQYLDAVDADQEAIRLSDTDVKTFETQYAAHKREQAH